MRKKWVIIATTVFLGVVCGVIFLNKKSHYPSDLVEAEIANHGLFCDNSSIVCAVSVGTVSSKTFFQRVENWYYSFRANWKMTTTTFLYSRSGSPHHFVVILHGKNNRIYGVEIKPENGAVQDALDLQSKLSKAFPDLPCKITSRAEPDFSNP